MKGLLMLKLLLFAGVLLSVSCKSMAEPVETIPVGIQDMYEENLPETDKEPED